MVFIVFQIPTGSDPTDTKRNKPEEYAIKYRISEWEIEELTTALIAEYNATPHSGLGYLSPWRLIEATHSRYFVRTLGEEERENLSFCITCKENHSRKGSKTIYSI
ncbi:hypothetical protein ACT7DB_03370 [Bacillus cereus]